MKTPDNLKLFALSSALLALSGQVYANPEVGMDSSVSTGIVQVGTNTVLNKVDVTCPEKGNLVATASAQFQGIGVDEPNFSYYLKKDNVFAGDHRYFYDTESFGLQFEILPPIQRVDTCNKGQKVTYRFQANTTSDVQAIKPRLVVVFYKDNI